MADKRKINIEILNEMMTILSSESTEYMRDLESFINNKINQTKSVNPTARTGQLFAITLLNLANELYELEEKEETRLEELLQKEKEFLEIERKNLEKSQEEMEKVLKKSKVHEKVLEDEKESLAKEKESLAKEIQDLKNKVNHHRQILNNKDQEMVHLQNISKEFERENERLRKELSYYEL